MSDQLTQPCLQESEEWPRMYNDIEHQRSSLEELSWFEREVQARLHASRAQSTDRCAWRAKVDGELKGLEQHSLPPRILNSSDLDPTLGFGRTRRSRHREKLPGTPTLPFSILVSRPVSRGGISRESTCNGSILERMEEPRG